MIDLSKITGEWIKKASGANQKADKSLVEKVIRARSLPEGLAKQERSSGLTILSRKKMGDRGTGEYLAEQAEEIESRSILFMSIKYLNSKKTRNDSVKK